MISYARFLALRSGDLIVWKGKYLRTVLKGPADSPSERPRSPGVACLELPIRHRSWRSRVITTYNFHDLRRLIKPAGKRIRGLLLPSEVETLKLAGFADLRKELRYELEQAEGIAERSGRSLCKAYPRIKKLALRGIGS